MVVPILQSVFALIIALFFFQVIRHLLAKSDNSIAQSFGSGLSWLVAA